MKIVRIVALAALALPIAIPAKAALVTANFSGAANLTEFGASSSSTFQGSVTWDSTSAPLLINSFEAYYPVDSISFSINSVDYSSLIQLPSIYVNESVLGDTFGVASSFLPLLDIGAGPDVALFFGLLSGPTSMISSLTPPASLDFLSLVTASQSAFRSPVPPFEAFGGGTFTVTAPAAVPEPGTLLSLGCGFLGLAYRIKRAGVGNKIALPDA